MVYVLTKTEDEILLVYHPLEKIEVGMTLEIHDKREDRSIIIQVIETGLVDLPGILEDVVRHESIRANAQVTQAAPQLYQKLQTDVRNMKTARAKIRYEKKNNQIQPWSGWTPTRASEIKPLSTNTLTTSLGLLGKRPVYIGDNALDNQAFNIDAYELQGINIIVGKKGSGKSHLAKTLLMGLIDHGAKIIVFDINNEYSDLRYDNKGGKSPYHDKIIVLEPEPILYGQQAEPLKFTLPYIGLDVFYSIMVDVLGLPDASATTIRNMWNDLENMGNLTLDGFFSETESQDRRVREAIYRRLRAIEETNIITTDTSKEKRLDDLLEKISKGGAIIINLKAKSKIAQSIIVQTILSKLRSILENPNSKPVFIYAEEAHFYLEQTSWIDLVTRMRHLGAFQFYITNTPQSIDDLIIRQTDNIFIFNLTDNNDLKHIQPATGIDKETIEAIAPSLPPRTFIAVGKATGNYPFIIKTRELNTKTTGETRLLWTDKNN